MKNKERASGYKKEELKSNYKERIEQLEKQIELFKKLDRYYIYFNRIKRNKNTFLVIMRKLILNKLIKEGVFLSEISRSLCRNHASVLHLEKQVFPQDLIDLVEPFFEEWIDKEVYPRSYAKKIPCYFSKLGTTTKIDYKLVPLPPFKK